LDYLKSAFALRRRSGRSTEIAGRSIHRTQQVAGDQTSIDQCRAQSVVGSACPMSDPGSLPFVWGATEAERAAIYPCDRFLPSAQHTFFRAIDVDAAPAVMYRWLQQLRVAPDSYDWADNFLLPSPSRLTPRAERIATGRSLTLGPRSRVAVALFGSLYGTYLVTPRASGGSRLFVKVIAKYPRSFYGRLVGGIMPWIDFWMMRKQLQRLKAYAERATG
jgi:hypothetical protein